MSTESSKNFLKPFIKAAQKPLFLILLSFILGIYLVASSIFYKTHAQTEVTAWLGKGAKILLIFSVFWLVWRLINTLTRELHHWGEVRGNQSMGVICPLINNSLKVIASLVLINLVLPFLSLPEDYLSLARKATTVFLIASVAWLGLKLIHIFEQFILRRCSQRIKDNLHYRKIQTQITVLKKIAVALVIFLALVSILMVSDRVRELGAALLASAGIIAAIGTFAAQKTLSGVVGGIQIALTQPIHLNDMVMVENEIGTIEEISLSYVVIKLQDACRLIVPVNYFLEKPFQNLSRNLKDIQGSVRLFVNYSVSIEAVREAFKDILDVSTQWDRKIAELNVIEATSNQMVLQFSMSANDQVDLWSLRCVVREKLIAYIKANFPEALG